MVRVLHVFNMMSNGGIEHFVMDRYRLINREKIQFDFLITSEEDGYFDEEIKQLGGKVYHTCDMKHNLLGSFFQTAKIVKENHYSIVHRHTGNAVGYFDLWAAKLGGAKHLILHSHNNSAERIKIHNLFKKCFSLNCIRLACSEMAGKWLFGEKKFLLVRNAIDLSSFHYNSVWADEVRQKYQLGDSFVIGNIGRLDYQKNQSFLLDIFRSVLEMKADAKLVIVGGGHLYQSLKEKAESFGIEKNVIFTGQIDNVNEVINAFDVFCLPSCYEGFGITLIEAQSNGLRCFASEGRVPYESNITGNVHYVPLNENPKEWAEALLSVSGRSCEGQDKLLQQYEIKTQIPRLEAFYSRLEEYGNDIDYNGSL